MMIFKSFFIYFSFYAALAFFQNIERRVVQPHNVHRVFVDVGSIFLCFRMLRLLILVDGRSQTL